MMRGGASFLAVLLVSGVAGFWLLGADEEVGQPADRTLLDLLERSPAISPPETNPVPGPDESPDPRPGSMQVTLLDTTDRNRALIVGSTIRDAGFECDEIRTALPVDRDGFNWRVNCGDAQTYWVEVDEFGQMSARPMPYGDVEPPMFVPTVVEPGEGRTIDLPTPE